MNENMQFGPGKFFVVAENGEYIPIGTITNIEAKLRAEEIKELGGYIVPKNMLCMFCKYRRGCEYKENGKCERDKEVNNRES